MAAANSIEAAVRRARSDGRGLRLDAARIGGIAPRVWASRLAVAASIVVACWLGTILATSGGSGSDRWQAKASIAGRLGEAARLVTSSAPDARVAAVRSPAVQALLAAIVALPKTPGTPQAGAGVFATYDILLLEPSEAIPASWMIEIETPGLLVGVESGDAPFDEPARYDPAALAGGRIRLANVAVDGGRRTLPLRLATVVVEQGEGVDEASVIDATCVGPGGELVSARLACARRNGNGRTP